MKSKVIRLNNDEIDELLLMIEISKELYNQNIKEDAKHERYYKQRISILKNIENKIKL